MRENPLTAADTDADRCLAAVFPYKNLLLFVAVSYLLGCLLPVNDFVQYWSAGRLLLRGSNPYSPVQMLRTEQAVGWPNVTPLLVWSPPWSIPMFLPFVALPYRFAQTTWLFVNLTALLISWELLCAAYNVSSKERVIWLFIFLPAIVCLLIGQVTIVMLLGTVLCLRCLHRKRDFLGGVAAVPLAFKPQIVYLFWPALIVWAIARRRWLVLAGLLASVAALVTMAVVLNHSIFTAYLQQFRDASLFRYPSHTIGTILRRSFGEKRYWLQFLPCVAGLVWLTLHWRKRTAFDWTLELPLLAVVSLATSSYMWLYDLVLVLPALAQSVSWSRVEPKRRQYLLLAGFLGTNVAAAMFTFTPVRSGAFWWLLPWAYLFLYVVARSGCQEHKPTHQNTCPDVGCADVGLPPCTSSPPEND